MESGHRLFEIHDLNFKFQSEKKTHISIQFKLEILIDFVD